MGKTIKKNPVTKLRKKNLPGYGISKGVKKRETTLLKEYTNRNKVGGFIDRRIPDKEGASGEEGRGNRRYMIERMRELAPSGEAGEDEDLKFTHKGQILTSFNKFDIERSDDEEEDEDRGKISAELVADQFFAGGLLRPRDPNAPERGFAEVMAEKIAQSKKERFEKQEESEKIRQLTAKVDGQWADSIRFMEGTVNLKPGRSMDPTVVKTALADFEKMCMSMDSGPVALASATLSKNTPEVEREKQLARLGDKLEAPPSSVDVDKDNEPVAKRIPEASPPSEPAKRQSKKTSLHVSADALDDDDYYGISTNEKKEPVEKPKSDKPAKKTLLNLLRVLGEMKDHSNSAIVYICDKLDKTEYRGVKDAVENLVYCEALVELFKARVSNTGAGVRGMSTHAAPGIYCPELVRSLHLLVNLATPTRQAIGSDGHKLLKQILCVKTDLTKLDFASFGALSMHLAEPNSRLHKKDLPHYRAAALLRLFSLLSQVVQLYGDFPSARELFLPLLNTLNLLPRSLYPCELVTALEIVEKSITALCKKEKKLMTVVQKPKMLPLLEPKFQEKFTGRKKTDNNGRRGLQQKLKKEMRGAMKEVRRDTEFIAGVKRKQQKELDLERNVKTKKILSQLANQEGELRAMKFVKR